MKDFDRLVLALIVAIAPISVAHAAGESVEFKNGFPVTSKTKIFPFSKLKRGDKGVGYTVFAEDRITPFNVEVLGVMENMLGPNRDVILARLSGAEIEFTGVISGMSGSPVYIDGMLVGAVSYRFGAFSKEPIAGITPIEAMLSVWNSDEIEPPPPMPSFSGSVVLPSGNQGTRVVEGKAHGIRVADFRERGGLPAMKLPKVNPVVGPYDPIPIETPIGLAGFHPAIADLLRAELQEAGFTTVAGSGRAGPALRDQRRVEGNQASLSGRVRAAPIAPGGPVAAVLMRGDMNVAATGTVTLVDGPEVLAFGHPFLGYGHVVFPMATASILNTLATPLGSYKQGSTALEVGSITHDRLTTIAGRIGGVAPMIPVRISIDRGDASTKNNNGTSKAEVEIVKDGIWLPVLTNAVIASSGVGRMGFEAGGTIDLKAGITVGDRRLEYTDTYSAEAPIPVVLFAARDIATTVAQIARNNIVPANITAVDVELKVRSQVALAQLEQVLPDRSIVRPGEKLGLTARLRPHEKDPVTARLTVEIPLDARGDIEIFVGGGLELDRRDGDVYGERYPRNLDELLGILGERRPARALYARVYVQRAGLRSNADLLSSLPPSQRAALSMEPGRLTKSVTEALGPETSIPYREVVAGGIAVPVTVVR